MTTLLGFALAICLFRVWWLAGDLRYYRRLACADDHAVLWNWLRDTKTSVMAKWVADDPSSSTFTWECAHQFAPTPDLAVRKAMLAAEAATAAESLYADRPKEINT